MSVLVLFISSIRRTYGIREPQLDLLPGNAAVFTSPYLSVCIISAELIRTMRSLHPACSLAYMRQILLGKWVTTRSPLDSQWSLSPPAEAATNLLPFGVPGLCKRSPEVLAFLLARLVRKCKCSQYWKYN